MGTEKALKNKAELGKKEITKPLKILEVCDVLDT
jgi:hypothetical protein